MLLTFQNHVVWTRAQWRRFMAYTPLGMDEFGMSGRRSSTGRLGLKPIVTDEQLSRCISGFMQNGARAFRSGAHC